MKRFAWNESDLYVVCKLYIFWKDLLSTDKLIDIIQKELRYLNDYRLSGCALASRNAIEMKLRACDHLDFKKKCAPKQFPSQLHILAWDKAMTQASEQSADKY
jgi:hypothetical protein